MGKSDIAKIVANVKKGSDCAAVIPAIHCLVFTEKSRKKRGNLYYDSVSNILTICKIERKIGLLLPAFW